MLIELTRDCNSILNVVDMIVLNQCICRTNSQWNNTLGKCDLTYNNALEVSIYFDFDELILLLYLYDLTKSLIIVRFHLLLPEQPMFEWEQIIGEWFNIFLKNFCNIFPNFFHIHLYYYVKRVD